MDYITITSDTIMGKLKVMPTRLLNISSLPRQFLLQTLARLPNAPAEMSIVPLHNGLLYSVEMSKLMKNIKITRPVTLIHDEDTKNINVIIQNIHKYTSNKIINRIMLKREVSKISMHSRTGITIFMCNPHHTTDTIKKLGCVNVLQEGTSTYASVTIIRTTDPLCSGIAGLTMILNYFGIPFTVEVRQLIITKSWLFMRPHDLNKLYILKDEQRVDFDSVKNKTILQFSLGYTVYMPTEKGYKLITLKDTPINNNSIIQIIINYIKSVLQWIINKIVIKKKPVTQAISIKKEKKQKNKSKKHKK